MKRLFIGNLPPDTKIHELVDLFSTYGRVRASKLVTDMFTKKCKGFGFIEMEGHEARTAIKNLNNSTFKGNSLKVSFETTKQTSRKR